MLGKRAGRVRSFLRRILTLNGSPHGIALGFAVGLFLSVIPTFGLGMVAALAVAPFIKANLVATYLGTLVVNPFTGIFFYGLDYMAGRAILGGESGVDIPRTLSELFHSAGRIALPLYLGGVIVAAALSIAAYAVILWGVGAWRASRAEGPPDKRRGNNGDGSDAGQG